MHKCPVCWRTVKPTPWQTIPQHMDGVHNKCPGSGEPMSSAIRNMIEDATA